MSNYWNLQANPLNRVPKATNPVNSWYRSRDPNEYDTAQYSVGDEWINIINKEVWKLISLDGTASSKGELATWVLYSSLNTTVRTIVTDSGTATPSANGEISLLGGTNIATSAVGSTINVALTGEVSPAHGGTGLSSITAHNLLVGNGTSAANLIAPSSTSGVPLISQGSSSDPIYGTAGVAGGGTGVNSLIAYSVVCGGTTSTGALQSVASVGTAGQVLTSQGAGMLPTWTTGASGEISQVKYVLIDATGTYTPTPGMRYCIVEIVGGGGGGEWVNAHIATNAGAAGGGGAGGYAKNIFSAATIGVSQSVTIGAAGVGGSGAGDPNRPTAGGTTSFGALMSATGGGAAGTLGSGPNILVAPGGSGGTASGGIINAAGQPGGWGFGNGANNAGSSAGGMGGSSPFGGAGIGGVIRQNEQSAQAGSNATSYGSGGGGAAAAANLSSTANGGNGYQGVCLITEFID